MAFSIGQPAPVPVLLPHKGKPLRARRRPCGRCRSIGGWSSILAAQKLDDIFEDVTAMKPVATAYIDDRSIRFTNWADVLNTFDEGRRWEKGEVV